MNDIESTIEALQQRVDALEAENARLRQRGRRLPSAARGASRRQLLVGGAGLLGALASGSLIGRAEPALAAPALIPITKPSQSKYLSLHVPLAPMKTKGTLWAEHTWEFGDHFRGSAPPVVVATAVDDLTDREPSACAVCAVSVLGKPGAYHAKIMVRNISKHATSVVVNAIAIGD
jgi:hypothetical protein